MQFLPIGMIRFLGLVTRRLSWVAGSLFSGLFGWDWLAMQSRVTDTCNETRLALGGMKLRRQCAMIGSGGQLLD